MSIYTPWETTQELYGETPVDPSDEGQVWWDEDGDPWVEYIFDSSDEEDYLFSSEEETDSESESDTDDLFPSEEEIDSESESDGESESESDFDPSSDEEQELMECQCCGHLWDGNAQCYCMCMGCEKCDPPNEEEDKEWDEESLVRETYGRRTYDFGDTKMGPIYVPSEEEADEEHTTMNYF